MDIVCDKRSRGTSKGVMDNLPSFLKLLAKFGFFMCCVLPGNLGQSVQYDDCGEIDELVAKYDPRAAVPWAASLYYKSSLCDFRQGFFSNAIIIGPTTVMTSGSFLWANKRKMFGFNPSMFMVAIGMKSKRVTATDQYTQFLRVSHIQPYQGSWDKYSNLDYALVHLATPITFSSRVRPICVSPDVQLKKRKKKKSKGRRLQLDQRALGEGQEQLYIHGINKASENLFQSHPVRLLRKRKCRRILNGEFSKLQNVVRELSSVKSLSCVVIDDNSSDDVEEDDDEDIDDGEKDPRFIDLEDVVQTDACFQKGSALTTQHNGKWHLVGTVAEGLGSDCKDNVYYISPLKKNSTDMLQWIQQSVRFSPRGYVCFNGQKVNYQRDVCNRIIDCNDGSDEAKTYCKALKCKGFSSFCSSRCQDTDEFKIGRNKFRFSTFAVTPTNFCPPLTAPKDVHVHCEEPGFPARRSCEDKSSPGTKAIFRCNNFDFENPRPDTYSVITCKSLGEWSKGLNKLNCSSKDETVPSTKPLPLDEKEEEAMPSMILDGVKELPDDSVEKEDPTSGDVTCPIITPSQGVEVTCKSPFSEQYTDCSNRSLPGTKASFQCQRYYKAAFQLSSVTKTCGRDGRWSLEKRNFECLLDCGVPPYDKLVGHVVSGKESDVSEWPWHGIIYISIPKYSPENYTYICGSTMISKKVLLTAAHCVTDRDGDPVDPNKFKVVLGAATNNLKDNEKDSNSQIFTVLRISVHPQFNQITYESDIAIIQLDHPAEITDFVRPSCYPTPNSNLDLLHLDAGSKGEIIGFGYDETGNPSSTLREATLPVVTYNQCYEVTEIRPSSTMYCAGYTNGTAACNGDSGGGMFFQDTAYIKRFFIQGIVSHGNRDEESRLCDYNQYTIFTKVASFKRWIIENGYYLDEEFV